MANGPIQTLPPESIVALDLPPSLMAVLLPASAGSPATLVSHCLLLLLDVTYPSGSVCLGRFCDRGTPEVRLHCTQAYVPTPKMSSDLQDDAFFIAPGPSTDTTTHTFRVSHFTPSPSEDVAY